MKNKKGHLYLMDYAIFFIVFLFPISLLGASAYIGFGMAIDTSTCEYSTHTIKGINGLTDYNDGFFSDGDVSSTTLIMEGDIVYTIPRRLSKVMFGQKVVIEECYNNRGDLIIDIVLECE